MQKGGFPQDRSETFIDKAAFCIIKKVRLETESFPSVGKFPDLEWIQAEKPILSQNWKWKYWQI